MERDETGLELIELAVASEATRGTWGPLGDEVLMQEIAGLADD